MTAPAPGSAEWLKLVTASKVAAILGVSPWESPRSIWHKMRGDVVEPQRESSVMSRGHYLESGVLAWWRDRHPEFIIVDPQRYVTRDDLPWAAATLDGLAWRYDPDDDAQDQMPIETVIVEVKTSSKSDEWGQPGTDEIPTHILTQVYFQLAMTPQAVRAYVAVLGPFLEFAEYVVERDEAIQTDLIARCAAFYASLSSDTPPDLDDSLATFETLKALHPDIDKGARAEIPPEVAAEYVAAVTDAKAAAAREVGAKSALLDAMGDAQYATTNGVRVARRQPNRFGVSLIATATPADLQETAA